MDAHGEPRPPRRLLDPQAPARIEAAVAAAVAAGALPGAVVRVERLPAPGQCTAPEAFELCVGQRALEPRPETLRADTVYDCASLTKGVVTATVFARLMQEGRVQAHHTLREALGEPGSGRPSAAVSQAGTMSITVAQLLTHTSGLPAGLGLDEPWSGPQEALERALVAVPTHPPGSVFRYSDINFILLGAIAQRLTGHRLDALARAWVFEPLRMHDSGFRPIAETTAHGVADLERIAPTEWEGPIGAAPEQRPAGAAMLRGVVHDPTARRMGGVAGHAGLFSTARDLGRYARMVLGGGVLDGVRVLQEQSVARMIAVATPSSLPEQRSLGWDIDSPLSRARGAVYPLGSFGHTGFTGCAMWMDPRSRTAHVLLSNRVHPRSRESIVALYEEVATLAARAALPD